MKTHLIAGDSIPIVFLAKILRSGLVAARSIRESIAGVMTRDRDRDGDRDRIGLSHERHDTQSCEKPE
jgi:hypothetical protein